VTPFGLKMRSLRAKRGLTLQDQGDFLGVSSAYISALEHGKRGRPSPALVDQICVWLELIWDEAELLKYLAQMSHPAPTIQTASLPPEATFLANLLAQNIDRLSAQQCRQIFEDLQGYLKQETDIDFDGEPPASSS
jgi:transcriptional regulator with XRE-family HTH domain